MGAQPVACPFDLNIAPPGYQTAFDSLRDVMNQRHRWADPMELERTQEVRDTIETPTRARGRNELHAWLQDQISLGLISDRATMVEALADAGFDLPRVGKAYLIAQDPDTDERWRLKGKIFHENWQADPVEREIERGTGHDPAGLRRLDGIPTGELQDRFEQHCDQCAAYNRDRYPHLSSTEQELARDTDMGNQNMADDLALVDHGDHRDGDRPDDGRELALDADAVQLRDEGAGPDADRQGGRDVAGTGPDQDAPVDLHTERQISDLHQDRGGFDDNTPDSLGTRLTRLRRAVGDSLRNLSAGIERIRSTLDRLDAESAGWYRRIRDAAGSFASRFNESITWIVERRSALQDAGRTIEHELELREGRRRETETELEAREAEMDRGLTH